MGSPLHARYVSASSRVHKSEHKEKRLTDMILNHMDQRGLKLGRLWCTFELSMCWMHAFTMSVVQYFLVAEIRRKSATVVCLPQLYAIYEILLTFSVNFYANTFGLGNGRQAATLKWPTCEIFDILLNLKSLILRKLNCLIDLRVVFSWRRATRNRQFWIGNSHWTESKFHAENRELE